MTDDLETPAPRIFGDLDRAILEFERLTWKFQGAKEAEILRRFEMSSTRYFSRLHWALAQPEAMAYDAQTVNRLTRLRAARADVQRYGTGGRPTSADNRGPRSRWA